MSNYYIISDFRRGYPRDVYLISEEDFDLIFNVINEEYNMHVECKGDIGIILKWKDEDSYLRCASLYHTCSYYPTGKWNKSIQIIGKYNLQ